MVHRRGFTLVELLIYIALFAITASALSSVYVSSLATDQLARHEQNLIETRRNAGITLRETIQSANVITTPASGSSGVLTVDGPGVQNGPVTFSLTGGTLYMETAAVPATALTSPDVTVSEFAVTRLPGTPPGVRVRLVLTTVSGTATLSEESEFIVTLRYE